MELRIHTTIVCVDCQDTSIWAFLDDSDWRVFRKAKAYFDLEGRCPKCQYFEEHSDGIFIVE